LKYAIDTSDFCCTLSNAMYLNVIGVSVTAVGVVNGENIGIDIDEDLCESLRGFFDIGLPETQRILIAGLTNHSAVFVAKKLDAIEAHKFGGLMGFNNAALPQRFAFVQNARLWFTLFTACGDDKNDTVPVSGSKSHQTAGGD
jgi:hypothetical protein